MKKAGFIAFFSLLILAQPVLARSGCCSHHGGVMSNGCGCNDGTPLSSTCAPYYSCSVEIIPTQKIVYPTSTPYPTRIPTLKPTLTPTPEPTATPTPTLTLTPSPTVSLTNKVTTSPTSSNLEEQKHESLWTKIINWLFGKE